MSGERLQDHWSSGFSLPTKLLLIQSEFFCFNLSSTGVVQQHCIMYNMYSTVLKLESVLFKKLFLHLYLISEFSMLLQISRE